MLEEFGVSHLNVDKVFVFCVKDEVKDTTTASNSPVNFTHVYKVGLFFFRKLSYISFTSAVLH